MTNVVTKIGQKLKKLNLDALLVTHPNSIRYVTEFFGENRGVLVTRKAAYLIIDPRADDRIAKKELGSGNICVVETKDVKKTLKQLTKDFSKIGFEETHVTVAGLKKLQRLFRGKKLKSSKELIESLRVHKTEDEIEKMRKACEITDIIMQRLKKKMKIGVTEKAMATEMRKMALELGSEELAFDPIIAFGVNANVGHHVGNGKRLKKDDIIMIDIGVKYKGYCSDMTRTFLPKNASKELKRMFAAVKKAKENAEKIVRPGLATKKADEAARKTLEKYGYGKLFNHGLGHGIGMDVHEKPSVRKKSKEKFENNIAFTIEPGVYSETFGGIRIEDTYILKNGKPVALTGLKD